MSDEGKKSVGGEGGGERPVAFVPRLLLVSLARRWRGYLAMTGGLAIGTLALGLSVVAGPGAGRSLKAHLNAIFPAQRVVLHPRALSLIWLKVETAKITPATVQAVAALPGVARVSPEATIRFPISAQGSLVGNVIRTDVTVTGVEGWLLGDDKPTSFTYTPGSGERVPAVLSQYFLDLYNMTYAESNKLPKLTKMAAVGRQFDLILGESTLRPGNPANKKPASAPCRIAGLSRNPDLLGLAIPLAAVEDFNRWYGMEDKRYRALHVELESAEALDGIRDELTALGLEVRDREAPWRRAVVVVRLVGLGFLGLGGLVFVLALAYMGSSVGWIVTRRRREMAVLRALGASWIQAAALLASEIALAGFVGIAAGVGAATAAMIAANHWYQTLRTDWTFLPPDLFTVPWQWLAILGAACWLVAIAFSIKPVLACARESITMALSREG